MIMVVILLRLQNREVKMEGIELKKLREENNVKQTELAEFLGYMNGDVPNKSMISRFENGYAKINPRVEKLINLYFKERGL